jgi:RHS repeat-associated protein
VKRPNANRRTKTRIAPLALVLAGVAALSAQDTSRVPDSAPRLQSAELRVPSPEPRAPNRRVPNVAPLDLNVHFGDLPTAAAITRAHILPQPLLPVGGPPSTDDNRAIGAALEFYAGAGRIAGRARLEDFAHSQASSPWRASLMANLGTLCWQEGYFSRAAAYWDGAWQLAKNGKDPLSRAVADFAVGEFLEQATAFGQVDALESHLKELDGRPAAGTAANKVNLAREGLWTLVNKHEAATFSGPAALGVLLPMVKSRKTNAAATLSAYKADHHGTTLTALQQLAEQAGMPLEMRYVSQIDAIPIPSVVHLRSQHYAAVIGRENGAYVVRDVALGGQLQITDAALLDEATGYVMVPSSAAAQVGRAVTSEEGQNVIGHCVPGWPYDDDDCNCPSGGGPGMPTYAIHPVSTAITLSDTPVSYTPARGPALPFHIRYNQRTQRLPQTSEFGWLGPNWSMDWLSYVLDNVTITAPPWVITGVIVRGESLEKFTPYTGFTHWKHRTTLVQVANDPPRYERRLPDGSVEVFTFPDRAAALPNRRIFLTQVIDPQGQTVTFTYDASVRLVAVTDAVGQVSTLEYTDAADPMRLTNVTDPFGRTATLTYTGAGRLASVTDAVGMTSRFAYDEGGVLTGMTTPYGTTTFRQGMIGYFTSSYRWAEATDPAGGTERLEYHKYATAQQPASAPANEVPAGFDAWNQGLDGINSLYWDKQAMAEAPGNISRAVVTHWVVTAEMAYDHTAARNIPVSIKRPLERRVWYRYPGQPSNSPNGAGTGDNPSLIARVLEDGTTQLTQFTYNAQGRVTSRTDPLGRQTTYAYDTNGIDLLEVRQIKPGGSDLLASNGGYNAQHLPGTTTDAAGQTTTYTYNAAGQPLTVTNAKNETTTYTYDALTGQLLTMTGPVAGSTITYAYDAQGRLRTVTEPDGYSVTTDYDALDRVTKRAYPDDTFEAYVYNRLDVAEEHDRMDRVTRHYYDAAGRRTASRDPLGRTTRLQWCSCGNLQALVDGNGNSTSWEWDAQGRVTREVRAGGGTDTRYTYDATGRLKTVTDPKGQVATYTYASDDSQLSTSYANAVVATPGISYTYDPIYRRVASMADGTGTTTYTYKLPGQLGAGGIASVDGPLPSDTMTYDYDELGRITTRAINGAANTVSWGFDALGRLVSEINVLGTFSYAYDGFTSRLATVGYPNGQSSTYTYLPANQDERLQTIHHRYPSAATLSKFDYTYDAGGNILTLQHQAESAAPTVFRYGYDQADELLAATKWTTDPTPAVLKRYAYSYDGTGNRTSEQIDDAVTGTTYNTMNRLVSQEPAGGLRFGGMVSEPAAVTVAGRPAIVKADNSFFATVPIATGPNTIPIVATDPSGNSATKQYQVTSTGPTTTFTYDANGNLAGDGVRTLEWDARNQLVAINVGTHRSEFTYDGEQRRVRIVEKENGATESETKAIWCEDEICEERAADGTTVVRRAFGQGEQVGGVGRYFAADHVGSITEVTDGTTSLLARYAFDPWGNRTLITGTDITTVGFTGYRWQPNGSGWLSKYRFLDSSMGKWTAEDPAGLKEGPNLYAYVANNPLKTIDLLGDQVPVPIPPTGPGPVGIPFIPPGWLGIQEVFPLPDADVKDSPYPKEKPKQCKDWPKSWGCLASGALTPTGQHPNRSQAQLLVYALGYGDTEAIARKVALDNCSSAVPGNFTKRWWYVRHCKIIKCWRQ